MGRSVIITTPFPTVEEVAAAKGIKDSRLKSLLALVDRGAQRSSPSQPVKKKSSSKKTTAQGITSKSARAKR